MGGTPPLSDDEVRRTKEALAAHGGNKTHTADALGIPRSTLISRLSKLLPDGSEVDNGYRIKGTSTLYGPDGEVKATWVKTSQDQLSIEEIGAQVRAALDGYKPPAPNLESPKNTEAELATVYPLADWHVGLLAWRKETQVADYDLKLAQSTIKNAMTRLVVGSPSSKQGVVLGLGDLLHADNYQARTVRSGNLLDVDGRYPRVLTVATQLVIFTIDLALQKHEKVLVRILPGNHDDQSAIAVTLALKLYYTNNERVTVDDDAGRFWWWSWGKVLLGATHGDQAKMKDLAMVMATSAPEAWGKAKFRHIYTGHIHKETRIDINGVTSESFQTPVAPDSWAVGMGYRPARSVSAITHHKEQGEILRQKVNIL